MSNVICLGILVADVIARPVEVYPQRGELSLVQEIHPAIGGCAANTGIGLCKLGITTGVMGKVGRDGFGDFVRGELERHGMDVRGVQEDEKSPTSATMVMVGGDGERSFIHCTGANAAFALSDVNWELMAGAKLLHIAGHFLMPSFDGAPCAEVVKRAREMGLKTSLDTAWDASGRWIELLRPVLPHLDYFVPSLPEASRCAASAGAPAQTPEDVARFFQNEGVGVVAIKMGGAGSYIRTGDGEWHIPPFRVEAVDATGAGDAFAAGFLAGVMHGFDLEQTGRLANAVGACGVTQVGAVEGVRSLEETLAFIRQQDQENKNKNKKENALQGSAAP